MTPIKEIAIVIPYKFNNASLYLWMQTRDTQDELHGLLEFPGGKAESTESVVEAAVREVKEEVSIEIKADRLELFKVLPHIIGQKQLNLNLFLYQDNSHQFPLKGWHKCHNLSDLEKIRSKIPKINYSFIAEIIQNRDFSKLENS